MYVFMATYYSTFETGADVVSGRCSKIVHRHTQLPFYWRRKSTLLNRRCSRQTVLISTQ